VSLVDPYAAIVELAEREFALARDGRLEELCALAPAWEDLTASLPARAPAHARARLERAAQLQERTRTQLLGRRAEMLGELGAAARASRAADGYARIARGLIARVDRSA